MKPISQINGTPQMRAAFNGWVSNLILVRITQTVYNGFVQDKPYEIPFRGIVQPLSPRQIALKPEGERAWTWLQIHVMSNSPIKLNVGDKIIYNGVKFKIMNQLDYSAQNYMEYHAVQDYTNG